MMERAEMGGTALEWCAGTDVGRVRRLNEDAMLARPPAFVVADGMGGHDAGEVASALTVSRLEAAVENGPPTIDEVADELHNINSLLRSACPDDAAGPNMGTTAVGLVMAHHADVLSWLVFNVGDSRAYRALGGSLTQISRDHSHVQDLVDLGELDPALMRTHPHRNVVTRALGADPEVQPDYWVRPLRAGERFMLCSDGLTGEVEDDVIRELLTSDLTAGECVEALIDRALANGGRDNVTVIVVDVISVPASDDATTDTRPGEVEHAPLVLDLSADAITAVPLGGRAELFPDGEPDDGPVISVVPPVFPIAVPPPVPRVIEPIGEVPHIQPETADSKSEQGEVAAPIIEAMPANLVAATTVDPVATRPDDD